MIIADIGSLMFPEMSTYNDEHYYIDIIISINIHKSIVSYALNDLVSKLILRFFNFNIGEFWPGVF